MQKSFFAVLLLSAFALCSFTMKKKKAAGLARSSTYIRFDRTPCFGRCGTYGMEIYDNGLVRFEGYMFTAHQGVYEKNYGAAVTKKYIAQFYALNPDASPEAYDVKIPDLPGLNFTYVRNGKKRQIRNANSGPETFEAFATKADEAFAVNSTWKKVADTANR